VDTHEPVRPDYQGACVAGIIPALMGNGAPWLPAPVQGARSVVLLVIDGLGWRMAREYHRDRMTVLSGLEGGPVTTVAPSTTAAALSSISTGLPPARHGVFGYRMRVGGQVLDVLQWRVSEGRPPEPDSVTSVQAFLGKPVPVVTRAEFARSGFTQAHMRGARFVGWRTTSTLVEQVRRLVAEGEELVYAYYDGVDKVAHEYGLRDRFLPAEIADADRLIGDLLEALPTDTALLVTADHGQVHFDEWVALDPVAPLVSGYAGDARFRYLYARPKGEARLADAARELAGDRAWVLTRKELVDDGWLGPEPPAGDVLNRIGDVALAARAGYAFIDPTWPLETRLVAGHGSLSADEMLVPLLAGRGRKGG
jgi:hypothetical protein